MGERRVAGGDQPAELAFLSDVDPGEHRAGQQKSADNGRNNPAFHGAKGIVPGTFGPSRGLSSV